MFYVNFQKIYKLSVQDIKRKKLRELIDVLKKLKFLLLQSPAISACR